MDAFVWNQNFVTGLAAVDGQHRHLVDLINRLGQRLGEGGVSRPDMDDLLDELAAYAEHHFREEEQFMVEAALDPRHREAHFAAHAGFLEEVVLMRAGVSDQDLAGARRLLDYLTHWLAFHILGQDQNMAAQLRAIAAGTTPAAAYEKGEEASSGATEPLLTALSGLFEQVSERNRELVKLAQELEERVQCRTVALVEANRKLEALSLTDVLTGLPNRRHAMVRLESLWQEGTDATLPLACMMIDADHFKAVNDTYGHHAGDQVLVAFATAIQHALRTDDMVFRLGGDEFLVICPHTDLGGALQVAERIAGRVRSLSVPVGDGYWQGSASIGVAARSGGMPHFDALIRQADQSVYLAKQAGRSCVRSAQLANH